MWSSREIFSTLQPESNQALKSFNHDASKELQIFSTKGEMKTGFAAIATR